MRASNNVDEQQSCSRRIHYVMHVVFSTDSCFTTVSKYLYFLFCTGSWFYY